METSRDARGFLRRLEDRIEELVSRDDRVSLAFSGGLTSTLLATVARKRCDLICLVAGTPTSPDVRASNAAKQHFDFRVESVLLDREIVRRNLQEMRALNRTMSMNSLRTLMPVYAVLGRHPGAVLLSGFGTPKTDLSIRRMLLGDGAVGKTSLIRRFVVDKFSDDYITTIGTKVTKKDLRLESPGKVTDLTFMIWDVLGQKGYKGIQESSFQGAKGALLIYDVTRPETSESLQDYWIPHLMSVTEAMPLVVVGNKVDLSDSRRNAQEALDDLKDVLGVPGFLSSAKTGLNVEVGFLALAKSIVSDLDAKLSARHVVEEAAHEFIVVADQIVMDFCDVMGGHEAAMPIVRQQLMKAGVDVRAPTREGLRLAVDYLAEAESSFRNAADVEASKKKRLGWIKTVP